MHVCLIPRAADLGMRLSRIKNKNSQKNNMFSNICSGWSAVLTADRMISQSVYL